MRNKRIFAFAGMIIAVICYLAILYLLQPYFTASGSQGMSAVGLIFSIFAALLCGIGIWVHTGDDSPEAYFYAFPAAYTGLVYLAIQCIVSLILLFLNLPFRSFLIIEFLITGVFGSGQCYVIYTGMRARELKEKMSEKVAGMRRLTVEAEGILAGISEPEYKNRMKKVTEAIKYANPVTEKDTILAEEQIGAELRRIRIAVRETDWMTFDSAADNIFRCLEDRKIMRMDNQR